MKYSIDLHSHSNYSDGMDNIYKIEEKCKRENIGLMLTDHNEIRGSLKLVARSQIVTLPAIEAGTKEGLEFLIYFRNVHDLEDFYKRAIEPYRRTRFMVQIDVPAVKLLSIAKEYQCFISLAHPFGFRKKSLLFHKNNAELLKTVFNHIDSYELYNGNLSEGDNFKALKYFEEANNLKVTIGSDGHNLNSIGQVTADFNAPAPIISLADVFDMINKNDFVMNTHNNISKIETAFNIFINHTKYFFNQQVKTN